MTRAGSTPQRSVLDNRVRAVAAGGNAGFELRVDPEVPVFSRVMRGGRQYGLGGQEGCRGHQEMSSADHECHPITKVELLRECPFGQGGRRQGIGGRSSL